MNKHKYTSLFFLALPLLMSTSISPASAMENAEEDRPSPTRRGLFQRSPSREEELLRALRRNPSEYNFSPRIVRVFTELNAETRAFNNDRLEWVELVMDNDPQIQAILEK